MWKNFIMKLDTNNIFEFNPPSSDNELLETEEALSIKLPESLKSFLGEINGFTNMPTIWSAHEIKENNISIWKSFTETCMPLDCILFFGGAGNGDYFGFPIINGDIWKESIYAWNHEDDSRTWIASSLKNFLETCSAGNLNI